MTATPTRIEMMLPHEIRTALARRPVVYLPLGTIEWHCEHLPVGLDALTAHGVCLRAAERDGGVVYPALHYGTGGGHGGYPWTVMLEGRAELEALLSTTLLRLEQFGVALVVLFSGHFAETQVEMVHELAAAWNEAGHSMRVLGVAINEVEGAPLKPDHAGPFETTLLHALHPDRVDLSRLPPKRSGVIDDDGWGPQRHVSGHPLWGIVGPDPRGFDPALGPVLLESAVAWLTGRVESVMDR